VLLFLDYVHIGHHTINSTGCQSLYDKDISLLCVIILRLCQSLDYVNHFMIRIYPYSVLLFLDYVHIGHHSTGCQSLYDKLLTLLLMLFIGVAKANKVIR